MSSETLSQQEIDQLFNSGSGEAPAEAERVASDVQIYDFRRPNLISKDRLRALDAMYGLLCKSLENWLMTRVRGPIDVQLLGVEHFSFGEFTLSLPNPTASYVYDVTGGAGQVVIDFGRDFSFFLVDRLLGSNGPPPVLDRALTVLERMVVRIAADYVAGQLKEIWKDHVALGLTLNRFESVPEILRTANREDPMLVAHVGVRASDLVGTLLLCIPFTVLEKFFTAGVQNLATRSGSAGNRVDRHAAETNLRGMSLSLYVRTPHVRLPLRDLAALEAGRTLMTGLSAAQPFLAIVQDRPRFLVEPGRAGATLAVRVREVLTSVESAEPMTRSNIMATVVQGGTGKDGAELDLAELKSAGVAADGSPLSSLFQVTLPVSIELGRARMSVQEVLELGRGSVIALERLVGEPVDVLVGEQRFAEGEVVVIGEQFGVRITRILASTNGNGSQP